MLAVHADAQDLGIFLLELTVSPPEPRDLVGSASSESQYMEGKYYVFLVLVVAQCYIFTCVGTEGEIRSRHPNC